MVAFCCGFILLRFRLFFRQQIIRDVQNQRRGKADNHPQHPEPSADGQPNRAGDPDV